MKKLIGKVVLSAEIFVESPTDIDLAKKTMTEVFQNRVKDLDIKNIKFTEEDIY